MSPLLPALSRSLLLTPASEAFSKSLPMPAPQVDSKRKKIPESQESRLQRLEVERWTTGALARTSLASSQTSIPTGGAQNFRPKQGERHFRLLPFLPHTLSSPSLL